MSWQTTPDTLEKPKSLNNPTTLGDLALSWEEAGIKPIVLRWKKITRTSQQIHGPSGVRVFKGEGLQGEVVVTATIDESRCTATFHPDTREIGVGAIAYAIIPYCRKNLEILAVTFYNNCAWDIMDPDVKREAQELADELGVPKVEPVKEDLTKSKDPIERLSQVITEKLKTPIVQAATVTPPIRKEEDLAEDLDLSDEDVQDDALDEAAESGHQGETARQKRRRLRREANSGTEQKLEQLIEKAE